jgi:hypothetical protein
MNLRLYASLKKQRGDRGASLALVITVLGGLGLLIAACCLTFTVMWKTMIGNEKTRLCGVCSKNVYNLSAMSQSEAESFLQNATELPCLKFYRRHDGTIMFDHCPKGM